MYGLPTRERALFSNGPPTSQVVLELMTATVSSKGATENHVLGYGISLSDEFVIAPGLTLSPALPVFTLEDLAEGTDRFADYVLRPDEGPRQLYSES